MSRDRRAAEPAPPRVLVLGWALALLSAVLTAVLNVSASDCPAGHSNFADGFLQLNGMETASLSAPIARAGSSYSISGWMRTDFHPPTGRVYLPECWLVSEAANPGGVRTTLQVGIGPATSANTPAV